MNHVPAYDNYRVHDSSRSHDSNRAHYEMDGHVKRHGSGLKRGVVQQRSEMSVDGMVMYPQTATDESDTDLDDADTKSGTGSDNGVVLATRQAHAKVYNNCKLSSSIPPVGSCIQKITVYETKSMLVLVAREPNLFRILRILRANPQQLSIIDDKIAYTAEEIDEMIQRYNNEAPEGIRKKVTAFMILGFITFVDCYYMILVTKRRKVGLLGGHSIYKVEDTVRVPISNSSESNKLEAKYLSMFQAVDITGNFYYCPTYDLTNTLQYNTVMYTKSQHNTKRAKRKPSNNGLSTSDKRACSKDSSQSKAPKPSTAAEAGQGLRQPSSDQLGDDQHTYTDDDRGNSVTQSKATAETRRRASESQSTSQFGTTPTNDGTTESPTHTRLRHSPPPPVTPRKGRRRFRTCLSHDPASGSFSPITGSKMLAFDAQSLRAGDLSRLQSNATPAEPQPKAEPDTTSKSDDDGFVFVDVSPSGHLISTMNGRDRRFIGTERNRMRSESPSIVIDSDVGMRSRLSDAMGVRRSRLECLRTVSTPVCEFVDQERTGEPDIDDGNIKRTVTLPHTGTAKAVPTLSTERTARLPTSESQAANEIKRMSNFHMGRRSPMTSPIVRASSAPPSSSTLRHVDTSVRVQASQPPEYVKRLLAVSGKFSSFNVAAFLVKCTDVLGLESSDLYIHSVKNRKGISVAVDLSAKGLHALENRSPDCLTRLGIVGVSDLPQSQPPVPEYEPPPFMGMFAWNHFLLEQMLPVCHRAWITPLVHGYISQAQLNIMGRLVSFLLIARRSRHFAGARFLKRGANEKGHVANHVESEQIVWQATTSSHDNGRYTSFVQMRGSIPAFWSQTDREMSSKYAPKPGITVDRVDPFATAAAIHFDSMRRRFGNPCVVLNLVKQKETKARESKLFHEFGSTIQYLNQFPSEEDKVIYIPFDMAKSAKSKHENVIDELGLIAKRCLSITGFFHSGPTVATQTDQIGGRDYSEHSIGRKQLGVLRVNCIDCLDRTNAACFMIGREMFANQLYVLGLIPDTQLSFSSDCVRVFEKMYEEHGDAIATQYGGSNLVNTMETYRKTSRSRLRDKAAAAQRYLSNAFNDEHKQGAINLFLGKFQPKMHRGSLTNTPRTPVSDYDLHYEPPALSWRQPVRSYTRWWSDMRGISHHLVYCIDGHLPPDNFYRDVDDCPTELQGAINIRERSRELALYNNTGHYYPQCNALTVFSEMFEYCEFFPFHGFAFRMLSTVHQNAEPEQSRPFQARERNKLQRVVSSSTHVAGKNSNQSHRLFLPSERFRQRHSSWYSIDEDDSYSVGGDSRMLSAIESDDESLSQQEGRLDVDKMPISKFINTYHEPSVYNGSLGPSWANNPGSTPQSEMSGLKQALTYLEIAASDGSHIHRSFSAGGSRFEQFSSARQSKHASRTPSTFGFQRTDTETHTDNLDSAQLRAKLFTASVKAVGHKADMEKIFNEYASIVTGFDQSGIDRGQSVDDTSGMGPETTVSRGVSDFYDEGLEDQGFLILPGSTIDLSSNELANTTQYESNSHDGTLTNSVDYASQDVVGGLSVGDEDDVTAHHTVDMAYTVYPEDEKMYKQTALPVILADNAAKGYDVFDFDEHTLALYRAHCDVYVAGF